MLIHPIVNEIVTNAKYRVYMGYDQITPKLTCLIKMIEGLLDL